jgi:hypothetical protein
MKKMRSGAEIRIFGNEKRLRSFSDFLIIAYKFQKTRIPTRGKDSMIPLGRLLDVSAVMTPPAATKVSNPKNKGLLCHRLKNPSMIKRYF